MENLIYILVGAALGFFLSEISARRRRNEERIEKQKFLTTILLPTA